MPTISKLVCAAFLVKGLSALAQANQEPLSVVVIKFPPYVQVDESAGDVHGSLIDKVRLLASRCNVKVDVVVSPAWARAYRLAEFGTVDALAPTIRTEAREPVFYFSSAPVMLSPRALLVPAESEHSAFTGLDMMKGKRVAYLAAGRVTEAFHDFMDSGAAVSVKRHSYLSLAENLVGGRADFAAGDSNVLMHHIGKLGGLHKVKLLEPAMEVLPQFLAMSRARAAEKPTRKALYECIAAQELPEAL